MSSIIEVKSINKAYPNIITAKSRFKSLVSLILNNKPYDGTKVLRDINLTVKKGESLAVIGKNGA
ncbi:MAG: ABC transporter ATP-binding protein, partial [Romboutsia sp.]|nr:ABC transporter ATP-binding protein [Romboutsia sp.]